MKRFQYAISILIVSLLIFGCGKKVDDSKNTEPIEKTPAVTKDSVIISMSGIDNKNVLEVLKENHEVTEVPSAMGTFIKGIDGIENDTRTFWFFSVNGEMASKSADNIMTQASDSIVWYFRQIGAQTTENKDSIDY